MKILIAYASKNGTTEDCVKRLCKELHGLDVTVADLNRETPNAAEFDLVITGSSVRFGKLLPAQKRFLKEQKDALKKTKLFLFLLCGIAHEYEYYRDVLFPKDLREAALGTVYFGGTLRREGHTFFERAVIRSIRSRIMESEIEDGEYTPSLPGILPENIERTATYVREEIKKQAKKKENGHDF